MGRRQPVFHIRLCPHLDVSLSYQDDKDLIQRLEVPVERVERRKYICKFDEQTARAFQLLDVLLHEIGHHHDRMTTRSKVDAARGEDYAEEYARKYQSIIWDRYIETFGLP